jgi:tetratricopeptide (TPR) repeat protein
MKRLLTFILCASVIFLSCKDNQTDAALLSAELSIDDSPESSLEILESVDKNLLSTRKLKAKYALLYSMALDKNFIDLQSDSIIAPAVKYYRHHGSKEEKFLSNYYHARIYENAGDKENALLCAIKAESVDTSKVSSQSKYLLYALKGDLYLKEWRLNEAISSFESACNYALKSHRYRHYAYYCLELANAYYYNSDFVKSMVWVKNAENFIDDFTIAEIHKYKRLVLLNMFDSGVAPDACVEYAEKYIEEYTSHKLTNWHIVAKAYLNAGNPDKAYEMIQKYSLNANSLTPYYGILADILEQRKDYQGALEAHKTFAEMVKERDVARHLSDIIVLEEHFEGELAQAHQRHLISYISGISLLLLLIIIYVVFKWRKERKQNMSDLNDLQQEYEALISLKENLDNSYHYLSEQMTGKFQTNQELMIILGQRIKSLAAFLQKPIPDSLSKVASQIEDLKRNKNYIVDSIGLLYAVNHPEFVSELRAHDLTSSEIGYCCLYLLGLNIPEAGEVIGRASSIYNVNSAIRKKLGIQGMNLDKWLIKHYTELCLRQHNEQNDKHS